MRSIPLFSLLIVAMALPGCGGDGMGRSSTTPATNIGRSPPSVMRAFPGPDATGVVAAQILDKSSGWALTTERFTWTDDRGATWREITPPGLERADIRDVFFLDSTTGWVVSLHLASDEAVPTPITVWRTGNAGRSWASHSFNGPEVPKYGPPAIGQMFLTFVDEEQGWLALDYATGMWRGSGLLYRTNDRGVSWERIAEADGGGGPVRFASEDLGWWIRGYDGPHLYLSRDGGASWELVDLAIPTGTQLTWPGELPVFDANSVGILPVEIAYPHWNDRMVFLSNDSGQSWTRGRTANSTGALAFVDASTWYEGDGQQLVITTNGGTTWENLHGYWYTNDPLPGTDNIDYLAPTALSFLDVATGWALLDSQHHSGAMIDGKYESFTRAVALIATDDGGKNWRNLNP